MYEENRIEGLLVKILAKKLFEMEAEKPYEKKESPSYEAHFMWSVRQTCSIRYFAFLGMNMSHSTVILMVVGLVEHKMH